MSRVATDMEDPHLQRNSDDFAVAQQIAASGSDHSVLMLNLNRYRPGSGYPDRGDYLEYISGLGPFLNNVGAAILWRLPVLGTQVGDQALDEVIAAWYPNHQAFVGLYDAPGARRNFALKSRCVEFAAIHRCPAERFPFAPA